MCTLTSAWVDEYVTHSMKKESKKKRNKSYFERERKREGDRYNESISMDICTCVWIKYAISHSMHIRCFRVSCWLVALEDFRWKHALKIEGIRHFPFLIVSHWIVNRLLFLKDQNINLQELRFFWQNLYWDKFPFLRFFQIYKYFLWIVINVFFFLRKCLYYYNRTSRMYIFVCEILGRQRNLTPRLFCIFVIFL